ncbi:MAG TPA: hypothetical protein H9881_14735, partial [Candidatus Stackebrandtia excrementipullorum]|nr:hypothetical protein [Candidatus Stackebrandtia excrementipullorum]
MSRRSTSAAVRDAAMPQRQRAVLYLRVSSKQQTETDYDPDGASISTQRTAASRRKATSTT